MHYENWIPRKCDFISILTEGDVSTYFVFLFYHILCVKPLKAKAIFVIAVTLLF